MKKKVLIIVLPCILVVIYFIHISINKKDYTRYISMDNNTEVYVNDESYTYGDIKDEYSLVADYAESSGVSGHIIEIDVYDCDEPDERLIESGYDKIYIIQMKGTSFYYVIDDGVVRQLDIR